MIRNFVSVWYVMVGVGVVGGGVRTTMIYIRNRNIYNMFKKGGVEGAGCIIVVLNLELPATIDPGVRLCQMMITTITITIIAQVL